jgi:hypothetical protein
MQSTRADVAGCAAAGQHLVGGALLDGDLGAARDLHVDGRGRRRDHEADTVVARQHRQGVGADLVADVAVGGDAIGADDDPADLAAGHQAGGDVVRLHRHRDAGLLQLPGGQPRALQPGPGLVGVDMRILPAAWALRTTPSAVP